MAVSTTETVVSSPSVASVLGPNRAVPVVVLHDAGSAGDLADAMLAGDLPLAEVTFRTRGAERVIRRMVAPDLLSEGRWDEVRDRCAATVATLGPVEDLSVSTAAHRGAQP